MELFRQLDAENKSPEENWQVLNTLEKEITVRRLANNLSSVISTVVLQANMIMCLCGLLLAMVWFREEFAPVRERLGLSFLDTPLAFFARFLGPWYVTLLFVVVFVFVIPVALAVAVKVLVHGVTGLCIKEKTQPLPSDEIGAVKALLERSGRLADKQKSACGVDMGAKPPLLGTVALILVAVVLCACGGLFTGELAGVYIAAVSAGSLIGGGVFWFVDLLISLLHTTVCDPLYRSKNHYPCRKALEGAAAAFDTRWEAVDPEERARREKQREQARKQAEEEAAKRAASQGSVFAGLPQYEYEKAKVAAYLRGEAPPAPPHNPADDWVVVPRPDIRDM